MRSFTSSPSLHLRQIAGVFELFRACAQFGWPPGEEMMAAQQMLGRYGHEGATNFWRFPEKEPAGTVCPPRLALGGGPQAGLPGAVRGIDDLDLDEPLPWDPSNASEWQAAAGRAAPRGRLAPLGRAIDLPAGQWTRMASEGVCDPPSRIVAIVGRSRPGRQERRTFSSCRVPATVARV